MGAEEGSEACTWSTPRSCRVFRGRSASPSTPIPPHRRYASLGRLGGAVVSNGVTKGSARAMDGYGSGMKAADNKIDRCQSSVRDAAAALIGAGGELTRGKPYCV